jgi:hypothetical protein
LLRRAVGTVSSEVVRKTAVPGILHEPEPFTGAVIAVGGVVLGVVALVGWLQHEEAIRCTDDVILSGFLTTARDTPVQRAVSSRLAMIETPRARRRLASDLRWRLKLADGTAKPSPGYMRASALPPLGPSERRVFLDERRLVLAMTKCLECAPVHPQVLVILWRVVTAPSGFDCDSDRRAGEELRRRLRAASALMLADDSGFETYPCSGTAGTDQKLAETISRK